MNYIKQGFQDGLVLTADHLNKMEDGILAINPFKGFEGKCVSLLADSITTFAEADGTRWIPDGYKCWYGPGTAVNQEGGNTHSASGINEIDKTWWKQVLNTMGMSLCVNAAWSGSRVSGNSADTSGSIGCGDGRIAALTVKEGVKSEMPVGTKPDIIIIFIGINDFGLSNVPVGTWDMKSLPAEGAQSTFDTAYALCVKKAMTAYPDAEVYCCTLLETTSSYDKASGWPTNNNAGATLQDYNNKIREIAHLMGANIIDLHGCGLNYFNCNSLCMDRIHPNVNGAKLMARKAIADIYAHSRYSHPIVDPVQKFTLSCKHVNANGEVISPITSTKYPVGTVVAVPGVADIAGYANVSISHSGYVTMDKDVEITYVYELDGSAIQVTLGTLKNNTWINSAGAENTLSNWYSTDYIAVLPGAKTVTGAITAFDDGKNTTYPVSFYDTNKNLIANAGLVAPSGNTKFYDDIEVTVPTNAAYMRLCWTIEKYPHADTGETANLGVSPVFLWNMA